MGDREGQQLGNYRLVRLLGQGGFADVYLGQHLHLNTQAAIKILQIRLVGSDPEQFRKEAQAIASLVHPHIIRVLDFGIEDEVPFLVMDYAPGDTLRSHHPRGTCVPLASIVSYVKQITEALQYAHDKKLIHRDVKPENMLVGQNGEILLSDFGLVLSAQSSRSRSTKEVAGTVSYMAPEQIQGRPRFASDQYALGIVIYEWLAGFPPFQGPPLEVYGQHLYASPPSLREHVPDIPSSIEEVILKALSKDPQERFANIKALATALEESYQLAKENLIELSIVTSSPDQSIQSVAVKTPPTEATEPTPVKTPIGEIAGADLIKTPVSEVTEAPPIKTPIGEIAEPDLIMTSLGEATVTAALETPLDESTEPTFVKISTDGSTEPTLIEIPDPEPASLPAEGVLAESSFDKAPTEEITPTGPGLESDISDPGRRKKRRGLIIALALLVLLVIFGSIAYALPGGRKVLTSLPFGHSKVSSDQNAASKGLASLVNASSATVTIVPRSKDLHNAYSIPAVTGTPDASAHQIQARLLSSTNSQAETVKSTGTGTSPATHASGVLTLYNYQQNSSVTLTAGTVIANMQSVVVNMVLEATVTDPAASDPSNPPTVNVAAYVEQTGTIGNLPPVNNGSAGFYYCSNCSNGNVKGWEIENDSAFSGGKAAQTVTEVQQSDIDSAAAQLQNSLTPGVQTAVQAQVRANEQLTNSPQCTSQTSSNHAAGDQVTSFTVTEMVTCKVEVYDYAGALAMAAQWLRQDASKSPGTGYALVGNIITTQIQVTGQGNLSILVNARGVWAFQFSNVQKQAMAKLIVGNNQADALALLSRQPGVAMVSIRLPAGDGNSLPMDLSQIKFVVQSVKGD